MELALLVGQLVNILSPAMPFLLGAAGAAANAASKSIGEEAWSVAQSLWARLRPRVDASPAAKEIVADVADQPSDENLRAALRWQLEKLLREDQGLAQELERLVASASPKVLNMNVRIKGDNNLVSGGDITITRGDFH